MHDLKRLFLALSPDLQSQIIADTGDPEKRFNANLDQARSASRGWWDQDYQKGRPVDMDHLEFLQRLAAAVQKALRWHPPS